MFLEMTDIFVAVILDERVLWMWLSFFYGISRKICCFSGSLNIDCKSVHYNLMSNPFLVSPALLLIFLWYLILSSTPFAVAPLLVPNLRGKTFVCLVYVVTWAQRRVGFPLFVRDAEASSEFGRARTRFFSRNKGDLRDGTVRSLVVVILLEGTHRVDGSGFIGHRENREMPFFRRLKQTSFALFRTFPPLKYTWLERSHYRTCVMRDTAE